ncbi:MAG: endonuclease/exonuclease/phosphatase family protein [Leptospiraceae bacterium]|nr:endonuclease/exonuclease/phosphatase family protein [Leptospiraceae bacterium]MCP5501163.1 endonuclease/exonuclease/phosphatase family protein [Leptospiraceae bacterium]
MLALSKNTSTDNVIRLGKSSSSSFVPGKEYRVIVWNIFKSKKRNWSSDFKQLKERYDLFLLQEVKLNHRKAILEAYNREMQWTFGESFHFRPAGNSYGILIGSDISDISSINLHGPVKEPFLLTPKSSLFSYYRIMESTKPFLIVNTHLINFRLNRSFQKQIDQIFHLIQQHKGPVVLAGDFNTWNPKRKQILVANCLESQLNEVNFANDKRRLVLDYIFTRELEVKEQEVLFDIRSSDHYPLCFSFRIRE